MASADVNTTDGTHDDRRSAISFDRARPRKSDPLGIEKASVEANTGSADISVMPIDIAEPEKIERKLADEKGTPTIEGLLQQQIGLLSDMQTLLREMNNRQAAADVSRQALPSVPEHSSSAWNPLLKSARERIDAIVDRWRGSLDVLLVFVGLFSAIVTSFFVDSVHNLSPDQAARTNELLANLTEIVIQISGIQAARLNITQSAPFVPDASDVRVNAYWSLALIISISAAALAVAGRAFLAVLRKSTGKPHEMLVDIHQRWAEAERILGPALETLPVILTIPVVLFLIGLLDNIFSAAMSSPRTSAPVIVAASLSATVLLLVGVVLFYTLVHANRHPETSPFRTTISRYIYTSSQRIKPQFPPRLFRWIKKHMYSSIGCIQVLGWKLQSRVQFKRISTRIRPYFQPWKSDVESQSLGIEHEIEKEVVEDTETEEATLEQYMANDQCLPHTDRAYHATLQATHEDDSLDQAAAAFPSICENRFTRYIFNNAVRWGPAKVLLSNLEIKSLVHLLSPEASYRCNLTASESILRLNRLRKADIPFCGTSQRLDLFSALSDAALRERERFKGSGDLWRSSFIQSFAVLSHRQRQTDSLPNKQPDFSRIVNILNSEYIEETERDHIFIGQRVSQMALAVLYDAAHGADTTPKYATDVFVDRLADSLNSSSSIAPLTVAKCLSRWTGFSRFSDIPIDPRDVIPSLIRRIWDNSVPTLEDVLMLISWGMRCDLRSSTTQAQGTCQWATVSQNMMHMMKTHRRPHLDALPYPEQHDVITGHLLLREIVAHLEKSVKYKSGGRYHFVPNTSAITHAFSAVFEMLSWQLESPLSEDQRVDNPRAVDDALLRILGSSPLDSCSPVDVAACLACWDGTNIFTSSTTESDLESGSNKSAPRKVFVDAMVRWLWKKVPSGDLLHHVNHIIHSWALWFCPPYRYIVDVLMSLIHFESSRTDSLDLAFSVLHDLLRTDNTFDRNFLPLATGLVNLIIAHTREHHRNLSREQAELLVSVHDRIRTLQDLRLYSWREDEAEVEKQEVLMLFRTLWEDINDSIRLMIPIPETVV